MIDFFILHENWFLVLLIVLFLTHAISKLLPPASPVLIGLKLTLKMINKILSKLVKRVIKKK